MPSPDYEPSQTPYVSLILPAYNEAAVISTTIKEALAFCDAAALTCEIIVVADGNDGTREIVSELAAADPRIKCMGSSQRSGKGRAVREAVELASGAVIGYADADNKVPIDEFRLVQPLLAEGADIVIGSRALAKSVIERRQPLYRRVGSRVFHVAMRAAVGLPQIHDTQCGFKFFRHEVAKQIFRDQIIDGYMFDVEILVLATRAGYELREVPIRWRDDGDSRLNLVAGNLKNARDILRIAWRRRGMWSRRFRLRLEP